MATATTSSAEQQSGSSDEHVLLSEADFAALLSELEALRHEAAAPGSIVRVRDRIGRVVEYELIAPTETNVARERVRLGSSVGRALLGARAGDQILLTLPNGRRRRVRVQDVQPASPGP